MLTSFNFTTLQRDAQRLYLSAEHSVQGRLEQVLNDAMQHLSGDSPISPVSHPFPDVLSVDCDYELLRSLGGVLQQELQRDELDQIACRLFQPSQPASTSDLMNSSRLSRLVDELDGFWVSDIIDRKRLVTYYQPIVNANDPTDIFGYECLTRGCADDGSMIPPYLLFDRARRADLLNKLDYAAFTTAVASIDSLQSSARFLLNVCPAVAGGQSGEFRRMLEQATSTLDSNNQIVIEITESERMESDEALSSVLSDFRSTGVRLALDDVGSGYSSLSLLAELQPELIKVDMSLVRGASQDPYRGCIVRKLIELARELDVKTVVEGVETIDDWRWAQDEGADYAQGYLFARPSETPVSPSTIAMNTQSAAIS